MHDDHITVTINKHKADQGGESDNKIKNIFANPSDPIQCPFLALFLLLITFTDTSFDGDNFLENEKVYNRWMKKVIDEMTEHEQIMHSITGKTLGPYSIRKGALSLCTGAPGGPPPAESHLRAGHHLGNTHHRYIFGSSGGDEMVGRVLCGGNLHSSTFAMLPPHFPKEFPISDADYRLIFPVFEQMKTACPTFLACLPYLLASGAYHWAFVKDVLKDRMDHCILKSAFSREIISERYLPHVLISNFDCEVTQMKATGIPPALSYTRDIVREVVAAEQRTDLRLTAIEGLLQIEGLN